MQFLFTTISSRYKKADLLTKNLFKMQYATMQIEPQHNEVIERLGPTLSISLVVA